MFLVQQEPEYALPLKVRQAMHMAIDRADHHRHAVGGLWLDHTVPGATPRGSAARASSRNQRVRSGRGPGAVGGGRSPRVGTQTPEIPYLQHYYTTEFTRQLHGGRGRDVEGCRAEGQLCVSTAQDRVVRQFYETGEYDVLYGCCADPGTREHYIHLHNYYKTACFIPTATTPPVSAIPELDEAMLTINEYL